MEKVLVAEVLYAQGHKKLNEKYIKCISNNFSVTLLDDGDYFSGVDDSLIDKRIPVKVLKVSRVEIIKTICHAINLKRIAKIAKETGIRNVILLSFHTEGFAMARRSFEGINVIVVHHYEIDRMTKIPKEIKSFNKFKNQITHCALEEFITKGIIKEFGVPREKAYTVNTPVDMVNMQMPNHDANLFIGIGQSTDQKLIDDLIRLDKEGYIKTDTQAKIILRSKAKSYNGTNVEVFTGFLEREEYDKLYREATACIVRYEPTYRLRSSGSIDDAFRNHKKVIVLGFPAGDSYAEMFPQNCVSVKRTEDVLDLLVSEPCLYDEEEGLKFEKMHSFEHVTEQWKAAINSTEQ